MAGATPPARVTTPGWNWALVASTPAGIADSATPLTGTARVEGQHHDRRAHPCHRRRGRHPRLDRFPCHAVTAREGLARARLRPPTRRPIRSAPYARRRSRQRRPARLPVSRGRDGRYPPDLLRLSGAGGPARRRRDVRRRGTLGRCRAGREPVAVAAGGWRAAHPAPSPPLVGRADLRL